MSKRTHYRSGEAQKANAPLVHVADRIFGQPLMIHENKLLAVLEAVGSRIDPLGYRSAIDALSPRQADGPLAAIALREQNDRKSYAVTDSGIAIIPISGMLMKKSTWMSSWSGMCTYEDIGEQFADALSDATVRGILFDLDSPGGETHGCFELTDAIYRARGQGKPIYGSANDLAASACYAIGSACDRLYVTRTGAVGSVGVYSMHRSQKAMDEKMGLKYTYISAGEKKTDGNPHEDLSDTAYAVAKAEVDRQYEMFVATVARNRGAKESAIVGTKALCYFAENAVPLLADEVGTLEDALAAIENQVTTGAMSVGSSPNRRLAKENQMTPTGTTAAGTAAGTAAAGLSAEDQAKLDSHKAEVTRLEALAAGTPAAAATTATSPTSIEVPATALAAAAPAPAPAPAPASPASPAPASASAAAPAPAPPASAAPAAQPAAAAPSNDYDDPDVDPDIDPEEPEVDANTNTNLNPNAAAGAAAPNAPKRTAATIIAELCIMNGKPAMAAQLQLDYAANKITIEKIREDFLAARAAESHQNMTDPSHSSGVSGGSPLDKMEQMAITMVQNSGGKFRKSAAYEQVLQQNPALYEDYEDQRAQAIHGGWKSKRQYISQMIPRFAAMGLGTMTTMGADNLPR